MGNNQYLTLLIFSSRFLPSPDSWEPNLQSSLAQEFCHSSLLDNNNNHGRPLNYLGIPCPTGDFLFYLFYFTLLYVTSYLSLSCSASNLSQVGFLRAAAYYTLPFSGFSQTSRVASSECFLSGTTRYSY